MSNNLLSYAGWTFLPNVRDPEYAAPVLPVHVTLTSTLVTGWVQSTYYGITIRAGEPKPQPGSQRYLKHRRRIHILVVFTYLCYTIVEAGYGIRRAGNFYQDLGLSPDVDEKAIKSKFRRLAALHHPDKTASNDPNGSSEAYFVHLKLAQDTLLDPVKRFAYDRFGPDVIKWRHCSSIRDYVMVGLQTTAPYYAASGLFMVILGVVGYLEWGRYWRYLSFTALLTFELHTLTRPDSTALSAMNLIFQALTKHPAYLPFELLILARKATITVFIAISQLGPLLQDPQRALLQHTEFAQQQQLNRLTQVARGNEIEATRLLALDMAPFTGDEQALKDVRGKMKEWLVQNTIRADPEVRDAVGKVMGRRREGAPVRARAIP
ncbi:MAG: hypothetical protein M1830_000235 [Pleopsidium flavum]|nr:MAG: hypothetical protein M1830_000235 [Pleopsidium flavum]